MILTVNDKPTSIGAIPFPAITVCPTQKFDESKTDIDHLTQVIDELNKNHLENLTLSSEM